jgi:hypothetical protein
VLSNRPSANDVATAAPILLISVSLCLVPM